MTTNLNKPLALRESPLMNQTIRRKTLNDFGTGPYEGQGSGLQLEIFGRQLRGSNFDSSPSNAAESPSNLKDKTSTKMNDY